jgi:photosystem II stability/assembly factor-like uncharacterized protein
VTFLVCPCLNPVHPAARGRHFTDRADRQFSPPSHSNLDRAAEWHDESPAGDPSSQFRVVWASGLGGTYTLTTAGGETWHAVVVPGEEKLQFRDVQAFGDKTAYLLAAGIGADSRIYKAEDGGQTWSLQFQNQNPNAFYDCFAFWTPKRGITMADSVNGRFPVIGTTDGET